MSYKLCSVHRAFGLLLTAVFLVACRSARPDEASDPAAPAPGSRLYHVQLQLTRDKDRAVEVLSRGQEWWTAQPASHRPPLVEGAPDSEAAASIAWKAPYYRIRLGPFATEAQAETVLDAARSHFPNAFVVPDRAASSAAADDGS